MKRLIATGLAATLSLLLASSASAADAKATRTWNAKCASCHGDDGKGQTKKGKEMAIVDMTSPAWQKSVTDDQIKTSIRDGANKEKDGKKQVMDPYKDKLKPEQIDDLTKLVRELGGK